MNNGGPSDTESDEDGFFSILTRTLVNRLRRAEGRIPEDFSSDEEDGDEEESLTPTFSPRLELFVGNLPFNVDQEMLLQCLNTSPLAAARSIDINQIIKPVRGRPFAFVRCDSRETFQEILAGNYVRHIQCNCHVCFPYFSSLDIGRSAAADCKKHENR